jgi:transketolase
MAPNKQEKTEALYQYLLATRILIVKSPQFLYFYIKISNMEKTKSELLAKAIRIDALKMVQRAHAQHIAAVFSIADIVAVLYSEILKINPKNPNADSHDYFILSKGHAGAAIYSVLAEKGFFPKQELETYGQPGTLLSEHVSSHGVPGIEWSTGSLGHGPSVGCGIAHAVKLDKKTNRVFVLIGDGESEEGSVWEAAAYANHFKLDNLTIIVDQNNQQALGDTEAIMSTASTLSQKWKAFGFETIEVNGHDHPQLINAFNQGTNGKPKCIIAHTIKGKGVSFMENNILWHYHDPQGELFEQALSELEKA